MSISTKDNFLKGGPQNYGDSYDLKFEIAEMLIRARISKGLSQANLAKLIKSKQPNIARIENGNSLPSLRTLDTIAQALGSYLISPKFAFLEEEDKKIESIQSTLKIKIPEGLWATPHNTSLEWTWAPEQSKVHSISQSVNP